MGEMRVGAGQGPAAGCGVPEDGFWSVGAASAALAAVAAAVDDLAAVDWAVPGTGEVLDLLRGVEVQAHRLHGVSVALVGQIESRGLAAPAGQSSTSVLVRQVLNIGRNDAGGRVRLAGAVCESVGVSGARVAARLPVLAAGVADGTVSGVHADVVVRTVCGFPVGVPGEVRVAVEQFLVEQAAVLDPVTFARVAREIALMADPDGTADERDACERQEFHIGRRRENGLTKVWGLLDDVTVEALRVAFGAVGSPSAERGRCRAPDATPPDPTPPEAPPAATPPDGGEPTDPAPTDAASGRDLDAADRPAEAPTADVPEPVGPEQPTNAAVAVDATAPADATALADVVVPDRAVVPADMAEPG